VKDTSYKGAIFLAVCRGKVSEGLDFKDDNGRAVVITGLPFPPLFDPKVQLKRKYLDEVSVSLGIVKNGNNSYKRTSLSGSEWYQQQASRAVNQAIGRVIRHRKDYGAIILCDERFSQRTTQNHLSAWLRPEIKVFNAFGETLVSLKTFFKEQGEKSSASSFKSSTSTSSSVKPYALTSTTSTGGGNTSLSPSYESPTLGSGYSLGSKLGPIAPYFFPSAGLTLPSGHKASGPNSGPTNNSEPKNEVQKARKDMSKAYTAKVEIKHMRPPTCSTLTP